MWFALVLTAWSSTPALAGEPLRFEWSTPCTVPVEDAVEKNGGRSTTRYDVRFEPLEDTHLAVYLEHFEAVSVEGRPVTGDEQQEFRRRMAQVGALPPFFVGRDGAFVGLPTDRAFIDRVFSAFRIKGKQAATVRALLSDDATRNLMIADTARMWWSWIGAWAGSAVEPGQTVTTTSTYLGGDGVAHLLPTTLSRSESTTTAELSAELVVPLELLGVDDLIEKLRQLLHHEPTGDELPMRRILASASTDPHTLRPAHTRLEVHDRVVPGVPEQIAIRDVTWRWDQATGCVVPKP